MGPPIDERFNTASSRGLSIQERIANKATPGENGCLLWTGGTNGKGYGKVWYQGVMKRVHKVVYELNVGPVPPGKEIDHTCNNRICLSLDHLQAVTHQKNVELRDERK